MIITTLSLFELIGLGQKDRVNEIIIDEHVRQITFNYYDINEGQLQKSYPFEALKLKLRKKTTAWRGDPIEIYFLKGKTEIMGLSKSKDGFDSETLTNLFDTLERLSKPIN